MYKPLKKKKVLVKWETSRKALYLIGWKKETLIGWEEREKMP